jgi:hypothetical protein
MATPNIPSKAVNAWIYVGEDDPDGTGYNSLNSAYQSLVNNNIYKYVDMLFVCFFAVIPDGKGFFTVQIGNASSTHPGGLTTEQYFQNVLTTSRNQNSNLKILATLNYNTNNLSQIFVGSSDPNQWQINANAFAANLYAYLVANKMNGLDIDWEGDFARKAITKEQFAILFQAIRTKFNTNPQQYFYITLSPAEVGTLDPNTVNTCFDFLNLQLYSNFTDTDEFTSAGVLPGLLQYGAQFEKGYGIWQSADSAFAGYQAGFSYNNTQYNYQVTTQWRLNSGNFIYEQSQQILYYQFIYGIQNSSFDDTAIISKSGKPPITAFQINSGEVLDAIQATNTLPGPIVLQLLQHGGNCGSPSSVALQPGDVISQISGYTGTWFGWNCIVQITIKTKNGNVYGPYGNMNNVSSKNPFSYVAPQGQSIIAFSGTTIHVPEVDGMLTYVVGSLNVSYSG